MATPDSGTYWKSGVGWVSPGSEYYSPPPSGHDVIKVTPPNTSGSFYEVDKNDKQFEPVTRGGETFLVEKGTVTQKVEQLPFPIKVPALPNAAPAPPTTKQPEVSDVKLKQEGGKATLTFAETGSGRSFEVGAQSKLRQSPFVSVYDPRLPIPEYRKPVPETVKQSTKNYAPLTKLVSSFQKSEFGQGVQSTVPLGLGIAGLTVVSPVVASVAVGGLLGYGVVATGASMAEKGFVRTIKEDFLSPRAIGSQVGFGVAAPVMPKVPKLFKVKTAGGATLKEVGNINAGVRKVSIEVHPIDVAEYYTKNLPKSEPTVTMRGTERTQVIAKSAVADVTARVQKTAPTGLVTEAPRGSGYAGTGRLFEPAKQAENVNRIVQDIAKNIPKPTEAGLNKPSLAAGIVERMAKAKEAGRGVPESKLSPVTQKLLDSTEIGASAGIDVNSIYGVQTRIGAVKDVKQFGSAVKIGSVARVNALKEFGTGKVLRKGDVVRGTVSSHKPVFGKVVSSEVAKRAQASGTTLIESKTKISGRVPELAYTKEGEYAFFTKSGKGEIQQDLIVKAPGGWRGLKRTALEAKKSVMAKASGLKAKGQDILNQIKQVGKQKPDRTLKYLSETYAKQNKIKASELADKKYYVELEKKNAARFETTAKEMKSREVKTSSGQSLAQKIEQEFNKADYDKPIPQMVPTRQVISAESVVPKPPFGVGNIVSGTSIPKAITPQYQPRASISAKAYIPKEKSSQASKQVPSLNVKPYESQIKLSSNIPTQKEGVEPILRQGIGSSIIQDVNVRQDIAQINVQVPKQKQFQLLTPHQKTRQKLPPPEQKMVKTFFGGSESRRIKPTIKIKQPKGLYKKGKPWRLRLATWENVSITEAATGKKAHHTLLKGKNIKKYDIQAYSQGASFRYPTAEQKRGLA